MRLQVRDWSSIYPMLFQLAAFARRLNVEESLTGRVAAIPGGVILWRLQEPVDVLLRRRPKGLM